MAEQRPYIVTRSYLLALVWTFVVGVAALQDRRRRIGFEVVPLYNTHLSTEIARVHKLTNF